MAPHDAGFEEPRSSFSADGIARTMPQKLPSQALKCVDVDERRLVCVKAIKNNKDFFDQSLDEIRCCDSLNRWEPDEHHILRLLDYFYFKEHLFIVSELLGDNLFDYSQYVSQSFDEPYFTESRLRWIARQCLEALRFIHGCGIIHCDLKPENIVLKSFKHADIKIIDFGSSVTTDRLTSYIQSRSYRAPEVILDCPTYK